MLSSVDDHDPIFDLFNPRSSSEEQNGMHKILNKNQICTPLYSVQYIIIISDTPCENYAKVGTTHLKYEC